MLSRQTMLMFDLDGTLIDTSQLFFQGIPQIVKGHLGLRVLQSDLLSMWGQPARDLFVHFAAKAGSAEVGLVNRMYSEFEHFYNRHHDELSVTYDHVEHCLPQLKARLRTIGVVTTRPTSRSKMIYRWPWSKHLDFIVWGDQVQRPKPAPDGLDLAIQQFGNGAVGAIYVGDNPHDIQAAKACRYQVISVAGLWGAMIPEVLLAASPDKAFETFRDFSDWIKSAGID